MSAETARVPLRVAASNDRELVVMYLQAVGAKNEGTARNYSRELERLALWSFLLRGKPLGALGFDDLQDYASFMVRPPSAWTGPRAPRASGRWRPFSSGVGKAGKATALSALSAFFEFGLSCGYFAYNPVNALIRDRRTSFEERRVQVHQRLLTQDMRRAIGLALSRWPSEHPQQLAERERLRFLMTLLYGIAPRIGELEKHTMGSFFQEDHRWWWLVRGKGDKLARVPLVDDVVEGLTAYRQFLGLPAIPVIGETTPLLLSLSDIVAGQNLGKEAQRKSFYSSCHGLTARQANRLLKSLFAQAADILRPDNPTEADILTHASAHWGRHTSITMKVEAGVEMRYVQQDARHQDYRTTALYVHSEDQKRHEAAQAVRLPGFDLKK